MNSCCVFPVALSNTSIIGCGITEYIQLDICIAKESIPDCDKLIKLNVGIVVSSIPRASKLLLLNKIGAVAILLIAVEPNPYPVIVSIERVKSLFFSNIAIFFSISINISFKCLFCELFITIFGSSGVSIKSFSKIRYTPV